MMNLDLIAEQLFNSVKGRFGNLTIGNDQGDVTNVPKEARFFDFDFGPQAKPIGKVSVSLDEENGIVIIYNKDMIDENYGQHKNDWFTFLKDMRMFSKRRLLKFEVRDITRSNLQKRDYKFLATNRPGDNTMSESKMYGNHKTSFQKFGSAKLSIKHNGTIGEGESRTSKIGSLFIETVDGEKFKYPFKHLSGARALATHIGEGGHAYDDFGKHITGLSEELSKLRKFNQYLNRSSVMAETLSKYTGNVKERMTSIKKEIANLQKPSYYTEAVKNYTVPVMEEVPNDVAENWIDQLTVKQFNEELKDIFPYIYNLVSESTLAETLTPESFLSEQDTYHKVSPGETITSIAQKYADHFPGGVQQGVEEIVDANGIANPKLIQVGTELVIPRVASEPVDIGGMPGGSTRGIDPKDNYSAADFKRLTNPSMEAAFEAALNTLMGQFAESINETKCNCDDEKCDDPRNHMDENEGNAYAHAVRTAKMNGKKKGDKIDHPDKDEDDIVIEKEKTPLGEFVLSYFDREQGTFPKGPTAVLTMVEKEYGEAYIKPAMEFIERIDAKVAEIMGYKETDVEESGLQYYTGKKKYGKDGMAKLAQAGRDGASEEELGRIKDKYKKESQDILKLAGLN
jgi:LysM repeat protein